MKRRAVHVGGRVWLHLCEAPPGLVRGQFVRVGGTVLELDEPGLPPGVRVQLDRTVNGADQCYATYSELHPLRSTPQRAR